MRCLTVFVPIVLLAAAATRGEGIRYTEIPADATGYFHLDVERFQASRLTQLDGMKDAAAQIGDALGRHSDLNFLAVRSNGDEGYIVLWHTKDADLRKRVEAMIKTPPKPQKMKAGDTDLVATSLSIAYSNQEIHYSSENLWQVLGASGGEMTRGNDASTEQLESGKHHSVVLSLGLGQRTNLTEGPTYVAFVGPDLMVASGDLPSIAKEIDVLQGKQPSLAQQDPNSLKMNAPPGAILLGAGLTAQLSANGKTDKLRDNRDAQSAPVDEAGAKGLGLDLFGPVQTKGRVAQFDLGENENQLYLDGVFTMKDSDAGEQLKNLIVGVKGLVFLTKPELRPLLDPLATTLEGKQVLLHWSWPVAKLPELVKLLQTEGDQPAPTTMPATPPAP